MEFLLLVALVFGLALLAVPMSARLPEEGFGEWVRSAFRSFGEPIGPKAEAVEVDIDDLFAAADDGTGYMNPEQLRDRVTQVRSDISHRRGELSRK